MKPDQRAEIVRRLRSASGHLNAVIEMSESGQACEEVLHQLSAVEAALRVAGIKLLTCHVHQSEANLLASTTPVQRAIELKRILSLYNILISKSNSFNEVIK